MTYTYQSVLDGEGHVLKTLVRRFYNKGVTDDPESDQWRQQQTRIVSATQINEPIAEEQFRIEFDPGTRIVDCIKGVVYRTPQSEIPAEHNSLSPWGIFATLGVMVSLATYRVASANAAQA